jgi:hypothetical protein
LNLLTRCQCNNIGLCLGRNNNSVALAFGAAVPHSNNLTLVLNFAGFGQNCNDSRNSCSYSSVGSVARIAVGNTAAIDAGAVGGGRSRTPGKTQGGRNAALAFVAGRSSFAAAALAFAAGPSSFDGEREVAFVGNKSR